MHAFQNPAVDEERTRICLPRDRYIKRVNPLQGIVQVRTVWVGLSIGIKRKKSTSRRAPCSENTRDDDNNLHRDVDTETEIVCHVVVNARDAYLRVLDRAEYLIEFLFLSCGVIGDELYSRGCTIGVAGLLYKVLLTDEGLPQLTGIKMIRIAFG